MSIDPEPKKKLPVKMHAAASYLTVQQRFMSVAEQYPDGFIQDDVEAATGMLHQTVSPIVRTGLREGWLTRIDRKKRTRTGRKARCLILTRFLKNKKPTGFFA